MSLLGAIAIRSELEAGAIVCVPKPKKIEAAHIDVHLGEHYWLFVPHVQGTFNSVDSFNVVEDDPEECFHLLRANTDGKIVLPPRAFALMHTEEYIGSAVFDLLPKLDTRSTFARWGFGVHTGAGWGDPGYCSRWTLEVHNPHDVTVILKAGMRVGSMSFMVLEEADPEQMYQRSYNQQASTWTPHAMLPRQGNF